MIIKIKNINPYGKYFLATEADDDDGTEEEATPKKRNVKVVSAGPDKRRKDFTKLPDDDTADAPDEPETSNDDTDFSDTSDDNSEDTTTDDTPDEPETNGDEQDFTDTDDGDTGDDSEGGEESSDEPAVDNGDDGGGAEDDSGEDDGPAIDEDDDTDFTDAGEDGEGGEGDDESGGDEDGDGDGGSDNDKKVGVDLSSTRKYNLYKEYMSLYNSCNNYINKLENVIKDDAEVNQIIRLSVVNLRKIKDLVYDYMTIRFTLNTYVQSLLFYQKMVVSVQLVFKMLASIKKNKPDKTKH